MKLSTKTKYALSALLVLASSKEKCISLNTISKTTELSSSYLEQLFIKLKKANLIMSVKGNLGGYSLTREPEKISILDVMSAVNEAVEICCDEPKKDSSKKSKPYICPSNSIWNELESRINEYFSTISLRDILKHQCCGISITQPVSLNNDIAIVK